MRKLSNKEDLMPANRIGLACVRSSLVFVVSLHVLTPSETVFAQTTPAPDRLPGPTSVEFDAERIAYLFHGVDVDYTYSLDHGGSLYALTARPRWGGREFFPSYYGGVSAELEGQISEPWTVDGQKNVQYKLNTVIRSNDTVAVNWQMKRGRDTTNYTIRMFLLGQTLVLDVTGDGKGKAAGLGFNQTSPSEGTKVIRVPYLTLFGLLYRRDGRSFMSLYVDWERTNASSITPWLDGRSTKTGFSSQRVEYGKLTSGNRNTLGERVYLSVARDLVNVLPNVVGPAAPRRRELWNRIVLSYGRFFPWMLRAPQQEDPNPNYVDRLHDAGVRDLAVLVKDWNKGQFDHTYPCSWPPDEYLKSACWGAPVAKQGEGGAAGLRKLRDALRAKGYWFGLHENFTDYHSSNCDLGTLMGKGEYRGLLPDGKPARTFTFDCRDRPSQAWLLKPSRVEAVARWSTGMIRSGMGGAQPVDWSYLDVSSAVNPSGPVAWDRERSLVDFDASVAGAGKFLSTVNAYRRLPSVVRGVYNGPVQGEGTNHFLYAGYFDGFEARLVTADGDFSGRSVPLLLDFALRKLHGRSAYHGVGHIQYFVSGNPSRSRDRVADDEIVEYIATELAFGHGSLVTKAVLPDYDHSITHAAKEQSYVLPVQKMYGMATPVQILYFDSNVGKTAAEFIGDHPDEFDVVQSSQFMGKVRVTYDNGVVVYVNRTAGPWTLDLDTGVDGWYSYNILRDGQPSLGTGAKPATRVVLPDKCGWVAYLPIRPAGN
jgi:hypothetical protein